MKLSIIVPIYKEMQNGDFFLKRCLDSIEKQTFKDYEIVMTYEGNAPHNTNLGILSAKSNIIKILYQDDYFTDEFALQIMVSAFHEDTNWLIVGSHNNIRPYYTGDIHKGNNKLGSPSALMFRRGDILFDEELVWLFDCDLYKRMYAKYGEPVILNGNYVTIGEGCHQATNNISLDLKLKEELIMSKKYV